MTLITTHRNQDHVGTLRTTTLFLYVGLAQCVFVYLRAPKRHNAWQRSLILFISDPTIILHFVAMFLYPHRGSFSKGSPPDSPPHVANFPVLFPFPGPYTSTIITIWQRRRVTVAFCWVVHAASATTRLTTRRITHTPQRPTRNGRRRRRRNPSSTLPRRRPILTATTHPSPVSK